MEQTNGGSAPDINSTTDAQSTFGLLVERYTEPLYWHIRRLVVVHEDAEDILQETFIRAYDKLPSFRGNAGQLPAWLYRIATNMALTALRRHKRYFFSSLDSVERELREKADEEFAPDAEEELVRFQKAVLSLPLKQRAVFNLRYYDEMPYAGIAEVLGQKEDTLKVNYHLAVKKIKEELTK